MKDNRSTASGVLTNGAPADLGSTKKEIARESRVEAWRRVDEDGRVYFHRIACILPAYQSGTPQWYRRIARETEARGDPARARLFREQANREELRLIKRALGESFSVAINAAHVLAACLRKRRMPAGAPRWMAQHALEQWLPSIPGHERHDIVSKLQGCPVRLLGKALAQQLANYS